MIENAAAIVAGVQAGETWAMEALYLVFDRGFRVRVALSLRDEVDDVTHDAYTATVQQLRRGLLREPEKLAGFIATILRRTIGEHIKILVKRRTRHEELDAIDAHDWLLPDAGMDPEEAFAQREREQIVARTMRDLKPSDQELLIRFYLCEQLEPQIRAEMRLSATKFRVRKSRALKRFGEAGQQQLQPKRRRAAA